MKISKASKDNVSEISDLVNSAYRGDSSRKGWTTEADLLEGIRINEDVLFNYFQANSSTILVCKDDDEKITGCVYLKKEDSHLYLGMLTVDPVLQDRGIGKLLLQASEEQAKRWNCNSILMTVISVRTELIKWYKKHGYEETGERQPFPNDPKFGVPKFPLEFIVMQKLLPSDKEAV